MEYIPRRVINQHEQQENEGETPSVFSCCIPCPIQESFPLAGSGQNPHYFPEGFISTHFPGILALIVLSYMALQ
jgi:hypothetical protein